MNPDAPLDELTRLVPAPRALALSDQRRAILADRVTARITAQDRRRARLARTGPPVVVAACLLSVLALAGTAWLTPFSQGHLPGRPIAASGQAVQALRTVAAVAAVEADPRVRDDQFAYVRSAAIGNDARLGEAPALGPVHEREIWLGEDPASDGGHDDVIHEYGQDWPIQWTGPYPAGVYRPTYAWLASLPTDPDRLLDALDRQLWVQTDEEPAQRLFRTIGNLIREQVLPPRTARTLYLATMRIPGVRLVPDATDALGRHGFGIARTDAVYHTSSTWVFDRHTHLLLGTRDYFVDRFGHATLVAAAAVLERAIVDEAGERPDGERPASGESPA